MSKNHWVLLDRLVKRADKHERAKPYNRKKHAFALWELAQVQGLLLIMLDKGK